MFWLVEAPSADAAGAVHRAAHGLVAREIFQVQEGCQMPGQSGTGRAGAAGGRVTALLARGADALWRDGDLRTARACFESAYRHAERAGDLPGAAEAALGLAGLGVHEYHGFADEAVVGDRLRRAAASVDPESPLGLRLHARSAADCDYRSAGHATILGALERARRSGDPVATAEALNLAFGCLLGPDHGPSRGRVAGDLMLAAPGTRRRGDLLLGMLWRTADLVIEGDPDARPALTRLRHELGVAGHRAVGHATQAIEVLFDIRAGRFSEAERAAQECAEAGEAAGQPRTRAWHAAQLVAIRWYQGRIGELQPLLEETVSLPDLSPTDYSFQSALALAGAVGKDTRDARRALARLTAYPLSDLPRSGAWLATVYQVVEAAYLLGDAAAAAGAYRLLRPYAGLAATIGPGIACFGSVEQALGVAKLTTGDPDAASEHLHRAVRDNESLGHRPALALARHRLAAALALAAPGAGRPAASPPAAARAAAIARREAADLDMVLPEGGAPAPTGAAADRPASPSCRREGRRWRVEAEGRCTVVEDCRGMAYLAVLLAHPGREIRPVELAAGIAGTAPGGHAHPVQSRSRANQPLLDERAIGRYRYRLTELDRELAALDRESAAPDGERGDGATPGGPGHADRARAERDWLRGQLRSATGLTGRRRTFPSAEERARVAVGKAIRRALRRLCDADADVGRALSTAIRTGHRCVYLPAAACPTEGGVQP